jgi:HlyD family secretion protein
VEAVSVDLGERVSSGDPLFAVLDPQRIEVPVELPVSVRDRVRTGARARLTIDSNPGVAWQARVARIAPRADESTRTFSVYVELNNSQQESPLLPGMFVRATIEGPTLTDALLVPRQSIQRDSVFVFDDGVARRRPVRVRRHVFDESIVDGVEPGETVIVSNLDLLHDGLKVQVRPLAPATAGEQPDAPSTAGDGGESRLPSSGAQGRIAHENGSQGT